MADEVDRDREERRRPYHHGDLRNALVEAGLRVLERDGASALNLREVARMAGVSHAAPYRHFADKQALLAAIADDGFNQLAARVRAAIEHAGEQAHAQLLEAGRAYLRFAVDRPHHLRLMFSGVVGKRAPETLLYAVSKSAFALLVGIMRHGQDQGVFREGDPVELSLTCWSLMHGLAMLLIEDQLPVSPEQQAMVDDLADMCIQRLCDGIATVQHEI